MNKFGKLKQLLYAAGTAGQSLADNIFGVYLVFFLLPPKESGMKELIYNKPVFIGLTVIGIIIIFGRIVDSISDPLIAWMSDNAKFRIGRRKFFLVTGALPLAAATALLFFPPDSAASTANAIYIAIILAFFFFAFTYYTAPYLALIPELSSNHNDRIFISIMIAVFSLLGAALVMVGIPMLQENLISKGSEITDALKISICFMSVLMFLFLIAGALPIKEKKYNTASSESIGLFKSLKMTLYNKTFIIYMIATILFWFAFNIIRTLIAYYPIVLLHKEQSFQTILMIVLFGSAVFSFFFINMLSKKITNKTLMLAGLLCFGVLLGFTFFIDMFGAHSLKVAYIHMALLGIPVSILLVIPNAMISDISEIDAHETGIRREAMFFGTQGFFMKINYGIAVAITSYLFAVFGKDAANPLGVKLAGPFGGIVAIIGFLVLLYYPQGTINTKLSKIREDR